MPRHERLPRSKVVRPLPRVRRQGPRVEILGIYDVPYFPDGDALVVEVLLHPPMAPPEVMHFQALSWINEFPLDTAETLFFLSRDGECLLGTDRDEILVPLGDWEG